MYCAMHLSPAMVSVLPRWPGSADYVRTRWIALTGFLIPSDYINYSVEAF